MKQADTKRSEPRYGPGKAAGVAICRPVMAVRRADQLTILKAWAVHGVGLVMSAVVVLILIGYASAPDWATPGGIVISILDVFRDFIGGFDRVITWVGLLLTVLAIELSWCVLAGVAMSWCARDEKLIESYVRALRRLLIWTPHVAVILLVCGGLMTAIERADWSYSGWFYAGDLFQVLVLIVSCLWALRTFLGALGCGRCVAMSRWPGCCMVCGYQLLGLRGDQGCPECGHQVAPSLSPSVRPGIRGPGGVGWWLMRSYAAVRRPGGLGRAIHVMSPDPGYRRCLVYTLGALILGSFLGFAILYVVVSSVEDWAGGYGSGPIIWYELIEATCMGGGLIGLLAVATVTMTTLFGAGLVGVLEGWRVERNLMPAAIRAACYQSGFMVLWAAVCWCNLTLFVTLMVLDLVRAFAFRHHIPMDMLIFVWQFGVIGLGLVIYLALVSRATRAARFANW